MIAIYLAFLIICARLTKSDSFSPLKKYKGLVNSSTNKQIFSQLQFSENAFFDEEQNIVGTLNFPPYHLFQRQPYVSNGYIGARIPNLGQGFAFDLLSNSSDSSLKDLSNGWPQFNKRFAGAFVAGFYNLQEKLSGNNFPWLEQYGSDSTLSAIPQWTTLVLTSVGGESLDPSLPSSKWGNITDYSQVLSFEDGTVTTSFTWLNKINLKFTVTANKHDVNVGMVTLEIHNPTDEVVFVKASDVLDFETSHNCKFHSLGPTQDGIFLMFSPANVKNVFGAISSRLTTTYDATEDVESGSTASKMGLQKNIYLDIQPHDTAFLQKVVGVVTTDLDPTKYDHAGKVLEAANKAASTIDYEILSDLHQEAWKASLGNTLEVIFPDDSLLTLAARSSIYHLHANSRDNAKGLTAALGVSGLSSDAYGGQVFWDTDLWILLGILPFNPRIAATLLNYRSHTRLQAIKNKESPSNPFSDSQGAVYPWTSGRYGNCTASGPCFDYEYHINSAIAYSAFNLYLSGSISEETLESQVYPIIHDAASFFSSYVYYNETLEKYTSHNLTDPDEFANHIDNGAYTNVAISKTVQWAVVIADHLNKTVPDIFRNIPGNIHIPTSSDDDRIILEYTDMPYSALIKQADVVMIAYPLDYEFESAEHAKANLDYYAMRQVSTGPAMTFPIFSIVASSVLNSGCAAESYLMKSVQPYLRAPFAQFSEQSSDSFEMNGGTHPAFPFLTAHGGFLQAILHGLLGFRFTYEIVGTKIFRYLEFKGHSLSLVPNGVFFPEIHYMNQTLQLNLTKDTLSITNNGPANDKGESPPIINIKEVSSNSFVTLKPHETVYFEVSSRKKVRKGSLTECGSAWFTNLNQATAGDVTLLMHDGSNSTRWKAAHDGTTKILIDLKETKSLRAGTINWGSNPPKLFKLHTESREEDNEMEFNLTLELLEKLSFDAKLNDKLYHQDEFFEQIYEEAVQISAPFNSTEYMKIKPVSRHNTTTFELSSQVETRFVLVEIEGVHNESIEGGAEIYSIDLF